MLSRHPPPHQRHHLHSDMCQHRTQRKGAPLRACLVPWPSSRCAGRPGAGASSRCGFSSHTGVPPSLAPSCLPAGHYTIEDTTACGAMLLQASSSAPFLAVCRSSMVVGRCCRDVGLLCSSGVRESEHPAIQSSDVMILQVLHCPHCQGTALIRHGTTRQGKQRYRCQKTHAKGARFCLMGCKCLQSL